MWIFDNQVEHASRENGRGSWLDHSHNVSPSRSFSSIVRAIAPATSVVRQQSSGFKREFDPGSESTLAACLTHASRTRKWSNP
jgi:hypothetical protein